jgi:tRNA U34 2-thiouridine synthase MnmA/TrmU
MKIALSLGADYATGIIAEKQKQRSTEKRFTSLKLVPIIIKINRILCQLSQEQLAKLLFLLELTKPEVRILLKWISYRREERFARFVFYWKSTFTEFLQQKLQPKECIVHNHVDPSTVNKEGL